MNITLKPEQVKLLNVLVSRGQYDSIEEAIATAFEWLADTAFLDEEESLEYQQWLRSTREKIQVGLNDIEQGNVLDGEMVIEHLRSKVKQVREVQA